MAEIKHENFDQNKPSISPLIFDDQSQQIKQARHTISRARSESSEEREQRLKMLRDKQNEERQKKLEELKAQALAAQQFREMKEQERKKRLEELRLKEIDRRQQVVERKRLIYEAERERRESVLKKNQEREVRYEMKRRNERSSSAFAFGSSTPRMLEPADTGGSFWGYRRATSTSNIMFSALPLTRRSSERELDGSKKRATSAGGLDRNNCEVIEDGVTPAGCASGFMGRRRTDLMPTIPNRESSALSKRPFTKSPGSSRPGSALSQQSTSSLASTVTLRQKSAGPRKPRPITMAGTGVTSFDTNKNNLLTSNKMDTAPKPPVPRARNPDRKKQTVTSTEQSQQQQAPERTKKPSQQKPAKPPKPASLVQSPVTDIPKQTVKQEGIAPVEKEVISTNNSKSQEEMKKQEQLVPVPDIKKEPDEVVQETPPSGERTNNEEEDQKSELIQVDPTPKMTAAKSEESTNRNDDNSEINDNPLENAEMSASMIAKTRITTEEEAKAALAERRRLAREEAERQALAEKLRQEQEEEKQRQEEELLRKLAEEQRKAEEERLAQAIAEAQKREEEERLRQQEELRLKLEREEQERKLREENEKKKAEMEERLRIEEAEREARRKRVEAIMLRTRAKGSPGNQTKNEGENEKNDQEMQNNKDVVNNKPILDMNDKNNMQEQDTLLNGTVKNNWQIISQENGSSHNESQSNGHKNGTTDNADKQIINITDNLLTFDPFKNTNLDISGNNKITMEDNVNSNNPTDPQETTDLLL